MISSRVNETLSIIYFIWFLLWDFTVLLYASFEFQFRGLLFVVLHELEMDEWIVDGVHNPKCLCLRGCSLVFVFVSLVFTGRAKEPWLIRRSSVNRPGTWGCCTGNDFLLDLY